MVVGALFDGAADASIAADVHDAPQGRGLGGCVERGAAHKACARICPLPLEALRLHAHGASCWILNVIRLQVRDR